MRTLPRARENREPGPESGSRAIVGRLVEGGGGWGGVVEVVAALGGRARWRAPRPGEGSGAGPRGARRLAQVRPPGRARHPGAGERARDGGARRLRRGVQGVAGTVRRGSRFSRRGIGWGGGAVRRPDPPAPESRLPPQPRALPPPATGA